jgi:hypothetical protein
MWLTVTLPRTKCGTKWPEPRSTHPLHFWELYTEVTPLQRHGHVALLCVKNVDEK